MRIYVFRNGATIKKLWSTDYCDVMFDEAAHSSGCGENRHLAYYDETDQLLYKHQICLSSSAEPAKATPCFLPPLPRLRLDFDL